MDNTNLSFNLDAIRLNRCNCNAWVLGYSSTVSPTHPTSKEQVILFAKYVLGVDADELIIRE